MKAERRKATEQATEQDRSSANSHAEADNQTFMLR